jgi:hypothetical protein
LTPLSWSLVSDRIVSRLIVSFSFFLPPLLASFRFMGPPRWPGMPGPQMGKVVPARMTLMHVRRDDCPAQGSPALAFCRTVIDTRRRNACSRTHAKPIALSAIEMPRSSMIVSPIAIDREIARRHSIPYQSLSSEWLGQ